MSEYLQLHDMPGLDLHWYEPTEKEIRPSTRFDEEIHHSSDVGDEPGIAGTMQLEASFDAGRAAPKAIRSYHFKIQVLQSEGAEKVRTGVCGSSIEKLFFCEPPLPFPLPVSG